MQEAFLRSHRITLEITAFLGILPSLVSSPYPRTPAGFSWKQFLDQSCARNFWSRGPLPGRRWHGLPCADDGGSQPGGEEEGLTVILSQWASSP